MKINVVGVSGSGKSTVSQKLAKIFDVPYIQMDQLFWKENWGTSTNEEMQEKLKKGMEADPSGWVVDGNYFKNCGTDIKWKDVDLVIWLDYSFLRTMWQVFKRSVARAWLRDELWPGTGNRESFWQTFCTRKSMIWWTYTTYWPFKQKIATEMEKTSNKNFQFVRLRSPQETEDFIEKLQKAK